MSEYYPVFRVHTLLLPSSPHPWWEEIKGNRVNYVIDANQNGVPDNGDLGIPLFGKAIPIQIHGTLGYDREPVQLVNRGWIKEKAGDFDFAKRPVAHTSESPRPERLFAESFAESSFDYWRKRQGEARGIVRATTGHPLVSSAIMGGTVAATLHPAGRLALTLVGALTSIGGGAYVVHDRIHGAISGAEMGRHDIAALVMMLGGVRAFEEVGPEIINLGARLRAVLFRPWDSKGGALFQVIGQGVGTAWENALELEVLFHPAELAAGGGIGIGAGTLSLFSAVGGNGVGEASGATLVHLPPIDRVRRIFSANQNPDFQSAFDVFKMHRRMPREGTKPWKEEEYQRLFVSKLEQLGVSFDNEWSLERESLIQAIRNVEDRLASSTLPEEQRKVISSHLDILEALGRDLLRAVP